MSTSKPTILPLVKESSIGGNVGSVQYVNVPAGDSLQPSLPRRAPAATTETRATAFALLLLADSEREPKPNERGHHLP